MLIRDDGLGFNPATITPDHLGIAIMRERASSIGASLIINSEIGTGTTIELVWKSKGGE
jgi:nitrate/nitrite-specific signal transduction histidine kinase